MLHAISYDVTDNERRRRLAETLKDFGRRVQYSVFECNLDEKAKKELMERIGRDIEPSEDSCRIYRICEGCAREVLILGRGERYREPKVAII